MTQQPVTAVDVVFPATRDIPDWQARHAAGEVPGRWPYGLDELDRWSGALTATSVADPSGTRSRLARLLPRLGRATPVPGAARDIALTWEENTAVAMRRLHRRAEMYCGVIWVTDSLTRAGYPHADLHRATLRAMTGVWVISRAQVEPLRDFLGPDGPPVSFIRFGVDDRFFTAAPYPQRPLVASVGGDRDRDPDTLFAALEQVALRVPEARIVVQSRSERPAPAGVEKIDHLTHRQLRDLYRRASVVAIATRPNLHVSGMTVSLEAMATGRPVVVTGSPGLEDYVEDGVTGLLTGQGDPAALADAVVELLAEPDRARRMGEAARTAVTTGMTTRHLVAGLAGVLGLEPVAAPVQESTA
ncbi:glycosyltransferase family 4 protein [Tersicoccus sp. Bi-70]|uniref:glycosyltransferase family 4 protein n=1 Tax=Tersicoccus sp. Bi-70 TaxID=1897634 RepID=UPI000976232B|nr:glycosyltransferase family 4 protein [Tersicoccus sp. Bi-70]OMH31371.1 hypothetical protein BGP79_10175 [Tersicoccus sp. Bi-70]